jgi:predicted PurR-regulated permease PerM
MKKLADLMKLQTTISTHTVIRTLSIVLAYALGVWFIYLTREALVLIIIAFFLAIALNPPVSFLSRRMPKDSRGLATAVAYLITLSLIGLLIYATVPPLIRQSQQFIDRLPEYVETLQTGDGLSTRIVNRFDLVEEARLTQSELAGRLSQAGGPVLGLLTRLSSSIASIIVVLVMTFFMLVEGPAWLERFWSLQPVERRKHRQELAKKMYHVVTGYVNGQLIIASFAAILILILLSIFRIPFAIPLAGIAGLMALIPVIGTTLGATIVVIVAAFTSLKAAVLIAIVFIVYQQVENAFIQPLIQARSVKLTPLLILISAIIGVTLSGFLGALLAIPTAGCIRVLVSDYIERHHLKNA